MTVHLEEPTSPPSVPWLSQLARIVNASVSSGTTANRPVRFLYPFRPYGDTTLGIPIWRNAANTAWVNASGTTV